jgi:hypothetical protein
MRITVRWATLALALLALTSPSVSATDVKIPYLELITRGTLTDGQFGFQSQGEMDLAVQGGERFTGQVVLDFTADSLEDPATQLLSFQLAAITWQAASGLPVAISWFIGEKSTFCAGDLFEALGASAAVGTRYSGFLHFPESETPYEGIHTVEGTGLQLDLVPRERNLLFSLYLYQDAQIDGDGDPATFDPGFYSADLRTALASRGLKLEAFLGATFPDPHSIWGTYRGGLLFHASDDGVEFLAQIGIPRWSPGAEPLDIGLLYMLFEPRVRLGPLAIIPTFFWHPAYYRQVPTGEQAFDININLQIGRPESRPEAEADGELEAEQPPARLLGGLETLFTYQIEQSGSAQSELQISLVPYLRLHSSAISWEVRLSSRLWPFSWSDLVEAFLSIQAEL